MRILLPVWLLAIASAASVLAQATTATVLRPVLNMHSGPSGDSDVVSQALYGMDVQVVETKERWANVRTPDEYTGWVPADELLDRGPDTRPYASQPNVVQVGSLFAHLYREPDVTKSAPLLTVPYETKLELVSPATLDRPRWMQVRLVDDRSAWLQAGDTMPADVRLTADQMVAISRKFLGLPYTWGGTSSFGYDCSGFTQMLCRRRGVLLPRDAGPQARWSGVVPVQREDLQPGDLLYFGPSEAKITHTGLYLGGGDFIHATTHDKPVIQVSRLDDPHWTGIHVASRRLK